jgi:MFS superfamily sulfate permease-like transporter
VIETERAGTTSASRSIAPCVGLHPDCEVMRWFASGDARGVVHRSDLVAGFLVFLIALPLSLGIAMASGFPPIAGVMTAIVGGLVVSFVGGARLTIKGPAAGLIVIVLGAVQELGQGDGVLGYRRALAVGAAAGVLQVVLALVGAASFGAAISPSVIHGMLAAIGVIIVAKQLHTVFGVAPDADEPLGLLAELPHSVVHENPEIAVIGLVSLFALAGWPWIRARWAKMVPAPVVVVLVAIPLGYLFDLDHRHTYSVAGHAYEVGPEYLVHLPGAFLKAVALPDFSALVSWTSLKYVVMFTLVGSIESTLSVLAVDALDPARRASNLNRDLLSVGLGNVVVASIGGLPMISEIVRSKANVDAGAASRGSNFFHGLFLLSFAVLAPAVLHRIPLAALAAMLVYTGLRLASPREILHVRALGIDQLALFLTTLVVTLFTDLLVGVVFGLALEVVLHVARGMPLTSFFGKHVEIETSGDELRVHVTSSATFLSLPSLRRSITAVPHGIRRVIVDLSDVSLVDHTFLHRLYAMSEEWPSAILELRGLEALVPVADHPLATRRRMKSR